MAEPEAVDQSFRQGQGAISEHIKHGFEDSELDENPVVRLFRTVAEGSVT